ncbi:MAG: redoxin domain-containing protein [Dehalococcoidia bacterium]|nr:redoxin domain-containing protein [Dehalococcoidia bacterium]
MDDLKGVFDKIEKAEEILNSLENKRTEKVIGKDAYAQLSQEHRSTIDSARQTIASIKAKLGKELSSKTMELDKYQEELAVLQTRLKVGEISKVTFDNKSKHLIDKIRTLEKKVTETQRLINTRFTQDIAPVLESQDMATASYTPIEQSVPVAATGENTAETVNDTRIKNEESAPATASIDDTAIKDTEVEQVVDKQQAEAASVEDTAIKKEDAAKLVVRAEPDFKPAVPDTEEKINTTQPEEENEEITRQKLLDALKIEPEAPASEQSGEKADAEKPEEKADEGKQEEKKGDAAKGHKPTLHLHPLRDKPPDVLKTSMPEHTGKNRFLTVVIAALVLGLVVWGAIVLFIPKSGPNVGDKATDFVMQIENENISALSSFRGKTVVLVFWDRDFWDRQFFHINGVQRRLYTPDKLNVLFKKYPQGDIEIIAIASGTSNNEIDELVSDYDIKFPVIVDSFGKLRDNYNITYEPTYIFIDANGIIRARVEGPITNLADLEQIIYNTSSNAKIKEIKAPITDVILQSITEKAATINWTTDKPTSTQVDIDGRNIQTVITPGPQTLHSLILRDLSPATAYRVRILYNIDNINVSEHSFSALADTIVSKRFVINTASKDTSPPDISNINTGLVTDSSITIVWKTDEPSTGEVDYSIDKSYSDSMSQIEKASTWHTVKIDSLEPDTMYYMRIRSKDTAGQETSQEIEQVKTQNLVEAAPKIGKRAPDFTLYSIDGAKFTLNQFLGYKILLNFWLEGCPACEAEMPLIQTAYDKYSRDQLIVLAVNVRGDPDTVSYYVAKEKITFPVLMDSQGDIDDLYSAPYFPTSYFIDTKGIIRYILEERFQTTTEIDDIISSLE